MTQGFKEFTNIAYICIYAYKAHADFLECLVPLEAYFKNTSVVSVLELCPTLCPSLPR